MIQLAVFIAFGVSFFGEPEAPRSIFSQLLSYASTVSGGGGNCASLSGVWKREETFGAGSACPGNFFYEYTFEVRMNAKRSRGCASIYVRIYCFGIPCKRILAVPLGLNVKRNTQTR